MIAWWWLISWLSHSSGFSTEWQFPVSISHSLSPTFSASSRWSVGHFLELWPLCLCVFTSLSHSLFYLFTLCHTNQIIELQPLLYTYYWWFIPIQVYKLCLVILSQCNWMCIISERVLPLVSSKSVKFLSNFLESWKKNKKLTSHKCLVLRAAPDCTLSSSRGIPWKGPIQVPCGIRWAAQIP